MRSLPDFNVFIIIVRICKACNFLWWSNINICLFCIWVKHVFSLKCKTTQGQLYWCSFIIWHDFILPKTNLVSLWLPSFFLYKITPFPWCSVAATEKKVEKKESKFGLSNWRKHLHSFSSKNPLMKSYENATAPSCRSSKTRNATENN